MHEILFSEYLREELGDTSSYSLSTSERSWGIRGKGLSLWNPAQLSEASPLGLQMTASFL